MTETSLNTENFKKTIEEFYSATSLTRESKARKMSSRLDLLLRDREGVVFIYEQCVELQNKGIFEGTAWNEPEKLIPSLVKGTLKSGHPASTFEALSELRILAATENKNDKLDSETATEFLEEVVINNLEFVFKDLLEDTRQKMTDNEIQKVFTLFDFIMDKLDLNGIKAALAEELFLSCAQRPVVTRRTRNIISTVKNKIDISGDTRADETLRFYVNALYAPSPLSKGNPGYDEYTRKINNASNDELTAEAEHLSNYLNETGLTNPFLALFMQRAMQQKNEKLVTACMGLSKTGKAQFENHRGFIYKIIDEIVTPVNHRSAYGLMRTLERGLLERSDVRAAINNLRTARLHPEVEESVLKSYIAEKGEITAKQLLLSAVFRILGQPLGVGQGNNNTCQSARGISMWSRHEPAKLLNMIITVCTRNNLIMRFENEELESGKLIKGLIDELDYDLDAVSVVLVPHLDKIYNEMMRRAAARGEDPHKWVNPAMYGDRVPIGFASNYNPLNNSIQDFKGFLKIFYAAFHPDYNENTNAVFPNPLGIYVTSAQGEMIGFHAIALLRTAKRENGEVRVYFLNPNNEGRQDWGQGITPSVHGNGELPGESSLPFYQLAARIYAFHYNSLTVLPRVPMVNTEEIAKIKYMAKNSWGKKYVWNEIQKIW